MVLREYVTGPISDTLAASVSAGLNERDGFFRDLGTGNRPNDRDRKFLRGQLLWDSGSGDRVRLIGDYDSINENCCAVVSVGQGAAAGAIRALGGQLTDPADPFSGVVYDNYDSSNDIRNWGLFRAGRHTAGGALRCDLHHGLSPHRCGDSAGFGLFQRRPHLPVSTRRTSRSRASRRSCG